MKYSNISSKIYLFKDDDGYQAHRKIFGIGIILVIIAAFTAVGFIFYDVRVTLPQAPRPKRVDAAIGKALVIYDPGVTGSANTVAGTCQRHAEQECPRH